MTRKTVQLIMFIALSAIAMPSPAATFSVNYFDADLPDQNPGDGICDAILAAPGNQCSLRAAVQEAGLLAGADIVSLPPGAVVTLDLPGAGGAAQGDLDIATGPLSVICALCIGEPKSQYPVIQVSGTGERIFDVAFLTQATFRRLVLRNGGGSAEGGGAIRAAAGANVTVDSVSFETNSAVQSGGAIAAFDVASLVVQNSHFEGNLSGGAGASFGGAAIFADNSGGAASSVSISRTSFRQNQDADSGSKAQIHLRGAITASIENVHVEGLAGGATGGVFTAGMNSLLVNSSTIVDSNATGLIAGVVAGGSLTLANTILAANATDCFVLQPNFVGSTERFNLIQGGGCSPTSGNITGMSPFLGGTQSSPGIFPQWRTPMLGSPVLDAANPDLFANTPCPAVDIRGGGRPIDGPDPGSEARCDIGAVEAQFAANTFTVNRIDVDAGDTNPGDGQCDSNPIVAGQQCTLRAAVMEANASAGIDAIVLPEGVIPLTIGTADDDADTAGSGDLDITEAVNIFGQGPGLTTVVRSGAADFRLFEIDIPVPGQSVLFVGFGMSGGRGQGGSTLSGGAIRMSSDTRLTALAVAFQNNTASVGGAIDLDAGTLELRNADINESTGDGQGLAIRIGEDASASLSTVSIRRSGTFFGVGRAADKGGHSGNAAVWQGLGSVLEMQNVSILDTQNAAAVGVNGAASTSLVHVTIDSNESFSRGLSVVPTSSSTLEMLNVILASAGENCSIAQTDQFQFDIKYTLFSTSPCSGIGQLPPDNFVGAPNLGPSRPVSTDPSDFFASWYREPMQGSAAIDTGSNFVSVPVDQRGGMRPLDGDVNGESRVDIGAVEAVPVQLFRDGFED